jgi:odorant receptor
LFQNFRDIDEITKNAATTLLFVTTSFRMVKFYWNRMRFVNITRSVDDGLRALTESSDGSTKKVVSGSVAYMRKLTVVFWVSALITANSMCINSVVQRLFYSSEVSSHPPTILRSWFPFSDYRQHFWVIYAVQYYIMNVGMLIVPCWHLFIVSLMLFIITDLKVLNQQLTEVEEESQLVKCIEKREKLVETVRELSSLINSSVFLDFLVFSVLLCALLFQTTQVGADAKTVCEFLIDCIHRWRATSFNWR